MNASSILIVDDDEATCVVLALALRGDGYQCKLAHSCGAAMACLEEGPPPDLILLDLLLPDANGIELLRRLTTRADWHGIPVVIMSAWGEADGIARSARRELLAKPFSLRLIEETVRRHVIPNSYPLT
ncbi:MAG: response regulator [Pseudomonadota bacterium]